MFNKIIKDITKIINLFKPKLIYRDNPDIPYLKRYYIIPNNKFFNVYLHKFYLSDYDLELHDHPWYNISFLLTGSYYEHIPACYASWIKNESRETTVIQRYPFIPIFRHAGYTHRIELLKDSKGNSIPIWTLFITGPSIREWGFWCKNGWRNNNKYLKIGPNGESTKGEGCD